MKTKPDNEIDFDPVENQAQVDYDNKFNEIADSPENKALEDQVDAGIGDGFRYTGDQDRDAIFEAENRGDSSDASGGQQEVAKLSESAGGSGGWRTSIYGKHPGLMGKLKGLGSKKKIAVAAGAGAGLGGIILILVLIIPFVSMLSVQQLATVLKTAALSNLHYSSYRRMSQYTVQESLDTRAPSIRGKVSAKLASYNPVKSMENLKQDGVMEYVTKDGKTRWTRRPTSTIEYIVIGGEYVKTPSPGRLNFYKQIKFMKEFDTALSNSEVFAGKSRYFRTRAANAYFRSNDIKLNRWLLKGRKIKTMADAIMSLYDKVKSPRLDSSIPEVKTSADKFEDDLPDALKEIRNPKDVEKTIANVAANSVKENGFASFARKASFGALMATLYCTAQDYVFQKDEVALSKGLAALRSAVATESAAHQGLFGDGTAPAIDLEATLNTGFEASYAYQKGVGVDPAILAAKEPDVDYSDTAVVDKRSNAAKILYAIVDLVIAAVTPLLTPIAVLNSTTVRGLMDRICGDINSPGGQAVILASEIFSEVITAILSGGAAVAVKETGQVGAEQVIKITFREAIKKLGAKRAAGIAVKQVNKSVLSMTAIQLLIAFGMDKFMSTNAPPLDTQEALAGKKDMGYKMLGNINSHAVGGRELTGAEKAEIDKLDRDTRLASLHKKPLWYRLASLSNPYSPASRFAVSYPKSTASLVEKARGFAFQSLNPVMAMNKAGSSLGVAALPSEVAYASTNESDDIKSYLFPTIGFSATELNRMLDGDYWPRENAAWMETGDRVSKLGEKYGSCYEEMPVGEVFMDQRDKDKRDPERKKCTPGFLSTTEAFRYRLYRMDGGYSSDSEEDRFDYAQGILGEVLDIQEVTASVGGSVGNPNNPTDPVDPTEDTSATPCPTGTEDGGTRQDYGPRRTPGVKLRICGLPGYIAKDTGVNASAAGNALALFKAASADGLNLSGSSFRSYDSQVALRRAHCGSSDYAIHEMPSGECRPPTARPGNSMHEIGLAIDFRGACRSRGSSCFKWLSANASKYGFKNLESEPWHWSTTGT